MSEKIKHIITAIGTFLAGILAGIAGVVLHNRRTTDPARKLAEDAGRGIERAQESVRDAARTSVDIADTAKNIAESAESIGRSIDRIEAGNTTAAGIIEQIRQQKLTDNSGM